MRKHTQTQAPFAIIQTVTQSLLVNSSIHDNTNRVAANMAAVGLYLPRKHKFEFRLDEYALPPLRTQTIQHETKREHWTLNSVFWKCVVRWENAITWKWIWCVLPANYAVYANTDITVSVLVLFSVRLLMFSTVKQRIHRDEIQIWRIPHDCDRIYGHWICICMHVV
jgi:hypothetical protein